MEQGGGTPPRQESAVDSDRTFLVSPPPWHLRGESIAYFDGRGIGLLVNYTHSPVGPYRETARAGLTARGPKVVRMAVDSPASRRGGRRNWGYPKTLQNISWQRRGQRIEVRTKGATLRWRIYGPAIPLRLPAFTIQRHRGRNVRVPIQVSGRASLAWRGRHLGIFLDDMTLDVAAPKF